MDTSADIVLSPEGDGTPEGVELGSLVWARQHLEEVKPHRQQGRWAIRGFNPHHPKDNKVTVIGNLGANGQVK
jgi:hypothetical protein